MTWHIFHIGIRNMTFFMTRHPKIFSQRELKDHKTRIFRINDRDNNNLGPILIQNFYFLFISVTQIEMEFHGIKFRTVYSDICLVSLGSIRI